MMGKTENLDVYDFWILGHWKSLYMDLHISNHFKQPRAIQIYFRKYYLLTIYNLEIENVENVDLTILEVSTFELVKLFIQEFLDLRNLKF